MQLYCLKVSLKRQDLKLLHECLSKIVEGNKLLEQAGKELFYGYLPPPPPFEEMFKAYSEDEEATFFFNHPVFGYYLFFDNQEHINPIGFIAIGLSGSEIEGFVNKSTHFVQTETGKGYGKEALKIILEVITPFIGQAIAFYPGATTLVPFRGISASVNIKNTPSIIMNARRMKLYDYREREQVKSSLTRKGKERWLSHGLYFYYTTLPEINPPRWGNLDLDRARSYLKDMITLTGSQREIVNNNFQQTQTLFLLSQRVQQKTGEISNSLKEVLPIRDITEMVLAYTGPFFRI